MYIENELWDWIERKCERANIEVTQEKIEDIIENCGCWWSYEGIKYETEDFDMTLEECYKEYWYVVDNNKIRFTSPDAFANDLDVYLIL